MGGEAEAAMYVFLANFFWKSSQSLGPKPRDVNYQIQVYQLAPVVCRSLGHSNASAKRGARCVRWVMCDFSNVILWRMSLIDFFIFSESKNWNPPNHWWKLIRSKDPTLRIEGGGSHVLWNPVFSQWKNMESWRYGEKWPVWWLTFAIHFVFVFFVHPFKCVV